MDLGMQLDTMRKRKGHLERCTVGRLITTEEQGLKQQDALPGYRILHCKISH